MQAMFNFAKKREEDLLRRLSACNNNPGQERLKANLQKKLCNHISDNMWKEKECIRLQQKLNKMQNQQGYTCIERAFVATTINPDSKPANISTVSSGQSNDTINWEDKAKRLSRILDAMQADKKENDDLITELQYELCQIPIALPVEHQRKPQTQAKLAKELIKLASTYKVPELTFVKKAARHLLTYQGWIARLHPILAMFPEMASVLKQEDIIPFIPADCIGNKALFLLISSRVDDYFQKPIHGFEGKGDKEQQFIKTKCANITADDTHHFHHLFTSIWIKENESTTSYFCHFTFGRMEAKGSGNTYTGKP